MATISHPATTALVENTGTQPYTQKKVTLGPANVIAYMFQGTGVFMCLGKLYRRLHQENDNSGTVLGHLILKFCRMDLFIFSALSVECNPLPALVNTHLFHLFITDNLPVGFIVLCFQCMLDKH